LVYYGGALNNNPHPANLDAPMFDATRFNTNSAQQLGSSINTFGTRYGSLRQDGAANVDLSLIKNTAITEKVKLQFRFEAKLELDLLGDGGVLDQREIHVGGSILAQAPVPGPERVDAASQLLGAVGIESRGVEHGGVEIGRVRVVVQRAPVVDEVAAEGKRRADLVHVDAVEIPSSHDPVQGTRMEVHRRTLAEGESVAATEDEAQWAVVGRDAFFRLRVGSIF